MKVYGQYELEEGKLKASTDEVAHEYDPLEHPEIVDHLTRLREGDDVPTLEFARTWGLLGWWVFEQTHRRSPHEEVDSVRWIWNIAKHVRDTLSLYERLVSDDRKKILDELALMIEPLGRPPARTEDTARMEAEQTIANTVNPFLGPIFKGVGHRLRTSPLTLEHEAPALLSAVFWHLAQIVSSKTPVTRCEECDRVFVMSHGQKAAPAEGRRAIIAGACSDSPPSERPVEPLLLTVEEAADLLRIGRNTCYELIKRGQIPHLRLGRLIRVPRHGLELWLAREAGGADASRFLTS
jgi:excisionase family DNA binding protein